MSAGVPFVSAIRLGPRDEVHLQVPPGTHVVVSNGPPGQVSMSIACKGAGAGAEQGAAVAGAVASLQRGPFAAACAPQKRRLPAAGPEPGAKDAAEPGAKDEAGPGAKAARACDAGHLDGPAATPEVQAEAGAVAGPAAAKEAGPAAAKAAKAAAKATKAADAEPGTVAACARRVVAALDQCCTACAPSWTVMCMRMLLTGVLKWVDHAKFSTFDVAVRELLDQRARSDRLAQVQQALALLSQVVERHADDDIAVAAVAASITGMSCAFGFQLGSHEKTVLAPLCDDLRAACARAGAAPALCDSCWQLCDAAYDLVRNSAVTCSVLELTDDGCEACLDKDPSQYRHSCMCGS